MTEHNRQIDFILSANKSKKLDKDKGDNDLEQKIEILKKEVDTLKTIIDLKDLERIQAVEDAKKESDKLMIDKINKYEMQINKLKKEAKDMLLYP